MTFEKIIDFYERGGLVENECAVLLLGSVSKENVDAIWVNCPLLVFQEIRTLVASWEPGIEWRCVNGESHFPTDEQMLLAKQALTRLPPISPR